MKKLKLANKFLYKIINATVVKKRCKNLLRLTIDNSEIMGIKEPFLCLSNHLSNQDVFVIGQTLSPRVVEYVCGIDQVALHPILFPLLGAIPKRQFAPSVGVVSEIIKILKHRCVALLPEARLSVDGTLGFIPFSVAKLVKLLRVNIVAVKISGTYLMQPRWSKKLRQTNTYAKATILIRKDEIPNLSTEEIYQRIVSGLSYDEYQRQIDEKIILDDENLAENLHTILYKCPYCKQEFTLSSKGKEIVCHNCNSVYRLNEYGIINSDKGQSLTVTSWYNNQRECVKQQILDQEIVDDCHVYLLIDEKQGYIDKGVGNFTVNKEGVSITFEGQTVFFNAKVLPAIAFDVGKHFFLSNANATYKIVPNDTIDKLAKVNLFIEEAHKLNV